MSPPKARGRCTRACTSCSRSGTRSSSGRRTWEGRSAVAPAAEHRPGRRSQPAAAKRRPGAPARSWRLRASQAAADRGDGARQPSPGPVRRRAPGPDEWIVIVAEDGLGFGRCPPPLRRWVLDAGRATRCPIIDAWRVAELPSPRRAPGTSANSPTVFAERQSSSSTSASSTNGPPAHIRGSHHVPLHRLRQVSFTDSRRPGGQSPSPARWGPGPHPLPACSVAPAGATSCARRWRRARPQHSRARARARTALGATVSGPREPAMRR